LYKDSQNYQQNKDYQFSVQALERAFEETFELQKSTCINCANVFQAEIIDSFKNIEDELYKMSGGLFGRRYIRSKNVVTKTLLRLTRKLEESKYANINIPNRNTGT